MHFDSLSAFYTSDIWQSFRMRIIAERTDAEGFVRSEVSGHIIQNKYDIIIHHKTELTLANVNDATISLNPDNVIIVSHKEHNAIHARFGYGNGRKAYIVSGAPCSGKTTYVNAIKGNSDLVVDVDNIWQCITGRERYYRSDALKGIMFHLRDELYDAVKTRRGNWQRAYVITSASGAALQSLARRLGAEVIVIDTAKEECISRLRSDPQGRDVDEWEEYIDEYFLYAG